MAYSNEPQLVSIKAGTTFPSTALYKFVILDTDGNAIDPNTTGNVLPFGVLYGVTKTTSTDSEAVPVAYGGVVKVQANASTLSVGNYVACSTDGYAIAPTTDGYVFGICIEGSSGAAGRILTVATIRGPLGATV